MLKKILLFMMGEFYMTILYEQISLTNKISLRDHHQYAIGHENQNSQIYFLKCSGNS